MTLILYSIKIRRTPICFRKFPFKKTKAPCQCSVLFLVQNQDLAFLKKGKPKNFPTRRLGVFQCSGIEREQEGVNRVYWSKGQKTFRKNRAKTFCAFSLASASSFTFKSCLRAFTGS